MNFLITLIILILVLGLIVFIHEFGHFLAAKRAGVYVSEFAIGMGPEIFSFKRKNDETKYSLRLLPLGGFNALATDEATSPDLRKDQVLENKTFLQRFLVLIMGIIFNIVLCVILLFLNGLIYGSPVTKPYLGNVEVNSAAYNAGLKKGDLILKIDDKKVNSFDEVLLETRYATKKGTYTFLIEREGVKEEIKVTPNFETDEEGNEVPVFGIQTSNIHEKGLINAIKYSFVQTYKCTTSVFKILGKLFSGKIGTDNLSGPIGVFSVIDNIKESGLENIIYLTAYLSVNVGIINLIPITIFDGGRILLLFIEKIKGKKLNPKVETYLNFAGTALIVLLTIYVTFNDIFRLL